jgi:hypothetical protein
MLGFTIGNSKYPKGDGCPSGIREPDLPPGSDGSLAKIMSTYLGISECTFTRFVPLGICDLNLIPTIIWVGVFVNGASVIITIEWGIATKYNGTNLTSFL